MIGTINIKESFKLRKKKKSNIISLSLVLVDSEKHAINSNANYIER